MKQAEDILQRLRAGKEAHTSKEQSALFQSINQLLETAVGQGPFDAEFYRLAGEILNLSVDSGFAEALSAELNPDILFAFGQQLVKVNNPAVVACMHGYLNVFRLSPFLKQVAGESRWPELIAAIIVASDFTVPRLLAQRLHAYKNKTLFRVLEGNSETKYTWQEAYEQIHRLSLALLGLVGAEKSKEVKIAFLMENSLSMALLDLACLSTGIVNIMIPANSVPSQIEFIVRQTGASFILLSNDKQLAKVKSIRSKLPTLQQVVLLSGSSMEPWVLSFEEFLKHAGGVNEALLSKKQNNLRSEQLATVMYTSGTTGDPKGIMFSQKNIIFKRFCRALALPDIGTNDRFLSFLPLYHTFGRWLEMMGSIFWAAEYAFMENPALSTMLDNMKRVHPTIFISIPKKWMQLYEHVAGHVDMERDDPETIQSFVKQASGGKLTWGLSAAGYLEPDVFRFFQANGIHLMSGFGMTEATGGITMTDYTDYVDNSLGKPLPGIEVKLGDDGEMLIRGDYVMMGYYGVDEQPFVDGWFPTGDIMRQDAKGYFEIIDRKKEIYKNIKGETIAPQKIENLFRDVEYVRQVFLVGDHKPFNTVLIHPNYEHADGKLKAMTDEEKQIYFSSVIVTVNQFLAPFERILDFRLVDRAFSADQGELTPKGTYKRRVIEKNFEQTINSMYAKTYIALKMDGLEVRVPNWFLREKGCLTHDLQVQGNTIRIAKHDLALTIMRADEAQTYRVGDFLYRSTKPFIDFQVFLANPFYWLGNRELMDFAGESIFQWYRLDAPDAKITFLRPVRTTSLTGEEKTTFTQMVQAGEQSLFGLNLAVKHFLSGQEQPVEMAVRYFKEVLTNDHLPIYPLVYALVRQPGYAPNQQALRKLFETGLPLFRGSHFGAYLETYLQSDCHFINEYLIRQMVSARKTEEDLIAIHNLIKSRVKEIAPETRLKLTSLPDLFTLMAEFGIRHPTRYKRVRQLVVRYQLQKDRKNLSVLASQVRERLLNGFRNWLGENQQISVDVETGDEYQWKDVIIFEETIPQTEREHLLRAISETSMLREAIFLFSEGNMVRLYDIPPGGIWISVLDDAEDKAVYRVSVQTRFQGGYDFVLNHSKTAVSEKTVQDMNWLIHAGAPAKGIRLIEDFGGLWRDMCIWTEDYYAGDTVGRFFERSLRRDTEENRERLKHLWPFFVRTAITAHVNFWRRTGYRLELVNKGADNIVIPPHDYQTGMRLVSIASRMESHSLHHLMLHFCEKFVKGTIERFPFLTVKDIHFNIFAGVLDSEGEEKGIPMLEEVLQSIRQTEDQALRSELERFLKAVNAERYVPRNLHFAIRRFHRWMQLNPDAALSARAQTLNELYDTYQLPGLEEKMPETRTRFFLETVFADSGEAVRGAMKKLIERQHSEHLSQEEIVTDLSALRRECELSEQEEYFLSRLSYPHLQPTDSALLLASSNIADVVVTLEDYDGIPYMVRKPVSPKEISRLHQLFLEANLPVSFAPEHRFLVAVSERGFVIGGLFYQVLDEQTVYMEKIVVSSHLRRKGISDGLMNEFFNRLRDEKYENVTTGFFRPEYFYRFGFKVERRYAGLVKKLV